MGESLWFVCFFSSARSDTLLTVGGVVGVVLGAEAFVGVGFVRVEHHLQDVAGAGQSQGGHFSTIPGRDGSRLDCKFLQNLVCFVEICIL